MTSPSDLTAFLARCRERIEAVLRQWGARAERELPDAVGAAVAYSLGVPGKRLRPALVIAVHQELGGRGDAAELAAAIEVVHTYSLVHDDLPCMDDDDLRRGHPTVHRRFGVATATEAGYRMVPLAARVLAAGAARLGLGPDVAGAAGRELFRAAGAAGMIGGQVLDLEAEGRPLSASELAAVHRAKTGRLIAASAVIGAIAAGAANGRLAAVRAYGEAVGLAFQIVDDVLDATASSADLGKTPGKDARQGKATFAALLGPDGAVAEAREQVRQAICHLGSAGIDSALLTDLARFVVDRKS